MFVLEQKRWCQNDKDCVRDLFRPIEKPFRHNQVCNSHHARDLRPLLQDSESSSRTGLPNKQRFIFFFSESRVALVVDGNNRRAM